LANRHRDLARLRLWFAQQNQDGFTEALTQDDQGPGRRAQQNNGLRSDPSLVLPTPLMIWMRPLLSALPKTALQFIDLKQFH
jgi:hypothetical protein